MPNWCSNVTLISHDDPKKIEELRAAINRGEFLKHLKPYAGEWNYDWCVKNWGSKWEVDVYSCEATDETQLLLQYESAWSPPTEAYRSSEFYILSAFREDGADLYGAYLDGEEILYSYIEELDSDKKVPLILKQYLCYTEEEEDDYWAL